MISAPPEIISVAPVTLVTAQMTVVPEPPAIEIVTTAPRTATPPQASLVVEPATPAKSVDLPANHVAPLESPSDGTGGN